MGATETIQTSKEESTSEAQSFQYIGKSLPKVDAVEKVTGRAVYGYDFVLPHMLFAKIKRSDLPHAEILSIDLSKAMLVPGVRAIITAKDVPDTLSGAGISDTPILAKDRVRYVGEPIAAVAADTLEAATEAASLIGVNYDELPAVFDPEEALKEKPPAVLHPDLMKYRITLKWAPVRDPKLPNVSNHVKVRKGDVDAAFKHADFVVQNRFTTNLVQHVHTEPNAVVAQFQNDGSVTIWTSTQSVYRSRYMIAEALQLQQSKVRIVATEVGGGFGNKLNSFSSEACAVILSKITRRPIKVQFTREEVFAATTTRHPFVIYIKDGVMKDGRVVAREIKAILDGGGYSGGSGVAVGRSTIFSAVTTYDLANIRIDTYRVYTNKVPSGAFRGFGTTQMVWAVECQMDILAEKLGMDPVQLRLVNLLKDGQLSGIGEAILGTDHAGCLIEVSKMIDLDQKRDLPHPWRVGKGIAVSEKYSGEPGACAAVRYRPDGAVEAWVSVQEIGQGTRTGLSQIVAEELEIPIERVKILQADSDITPYDSGALSSRQLFNIGNAAILACKDLKTNILQVAAKKLGTVPRELSMSGEDILGPNGEKTSIPDLFIRGKSRYGVFLEKGQDFWGYGTWFVETGELDPETGQVTRPRVNTAYTSVACAAEVAVNIETGQLKVVRTAVVADIGRAINPKLAEGQVEGSVSMGLSTSMCEELVLERGRPINPDFKDYKLLDVYGTPPIQVKFLENSTGDGPFGARPIGEAAIICVPSALANAIHDAVGVRLYDLPLTSERILRAIKNVQN